MFLEIAGLIAIVLEFITGLICVHFGVGITGGLVSGSTLPTGFSISTIANTFSFLYNVTTFQITDAPVLLTAVIWICNVIIFLMILDLGIKVVQAIGTWVP